jgi:hypothetical protein
MELSDSPCKTCILVAMCSHRGLQPGGINDLKSECSIIRNFVDSERRLQNFPVFERVYETFETIACGGSS